MGKYMIFIRWGGGIKIKSLNSPLLRWTLFDQAIKEEGIDTIVINPNIATVQVTSFIICDIIGGKKLENKRLQFFFCLMIIAKEQEFIFTYEPIYGCSDLFEMILLTGLQSDQINMTVTRVVLLPCKRWLCPVYATVHVHWSNFLQGIKNTRSCITINCSPCMDL